MNKLVELLEAERPVIPDSNADYYIGYNNGLVMAQAIVLKQDAVPVVRCKDCVYRIHDKASDEDWCNNTGGLGCRLKDDYFCPFGERREEE